MVEFSKYFQIKKVIILFVKHFSRLLLNHFTSILGNSDKETVVIIGPDTSDLARAVADFSGLFKIPVISPSATSPLLKDQDRFKYFFRTVPSDDYQVQMILDIVQYFAWNYVILLVSNDEYGRAARMAFDRKKDQLKVPICVAIDEILTPKNQLNIVNKLKNEAKAKVIILISNLNRAKIFIDLCYEHFIKNFTWIASDAWSKNSYVTNGKSDMFKGLFGISPLHVDITKYEKYRSFLANTMVSNKTDVWKKEFLSTEKCKCGNVSMEHCLTDENYEIAPYQIMSTMRAVYIVAHALHHLLSCDSKYCYNITSTNGAQLFRELKIWKNTNNPLFKTLFDGRSTSSPCYQLWGLKDQLDFESIGHWHYEESSDKRLVIRHEKIAWNTKNNTAPESSCSSRCIPGENVLVAPI